MPLLETKGAGSAQGFGLSLGSAEAVYVEDVFSTYLYDGNSSTQTITNGIDLAGEGGLVWVKARSGAFDQSHWLTDTVRGAGQALRTDTTNASVDVQSSFNQTFLSSGFSFNTTSNAVNNSGYPYASWTFRKQPKFFDVVTYTGNGTAGRTVAHDLGSVPGMIIVKRTDSASGWSVWHRSVNTSYGRLDTTDAFTTSAAEAIWGNGSVVVQPTSTVFTVGSSSTVNASGGTYVAYLFAHNAGGFGLEGTDNVISCGTFTTDADGFATVNLGYEPQLVMIKRTDSTGNWIIFDNMRGWSTDQAQLNPNSSGAEGVGGPLQIIQSTGFATKAFSFSGNSSNIYIAIRRGPMKVPTSGTQVYNAIARTGTGAVANVTGLGFTPDMLIGTPRSVTSGDRLVMDRLRGRGNLLANLTNQEANSLGNYDYTSINMDGFSVYLDQYGNVNYPGAPIINWAFKRAPGFFDEVCYTGTGSATTFSHNLSAVPELMIVKKRSAADAWVVYANNDNTDYLVLNTTAATLDDNTIWNDTSPTSSVFTVGTNDDVNGNTATFVAYLFATLAGVSKVGSYTGTGTTQVINCGFTAGSRFVMIKRTDSTGDWYVWDSARGIVAGDDPYLLLNSTAAEVTNTDYVDTASTGFEISSTAPAAINANGGSFIFFAVA